MTDVIVDTEGNALTNHEDGITQFWNDYEKDGIDAALAGVRARSENNDLKELELAVPYLVEEARNRDIDMIKFLTELDSAMAKEEEQDASGIDNGTGGIHPDSGDETDKAQDGDESGSAQDADGEDR